MTRSKLAEAEDWIIAHVRGNNHPMSDAKLQHIVVTLMESHFGLPNVLGNAHTRLVALSMYSDEVGLRGRAVIAALWMIREQGGRADDAVWGLLREAHDFLIGVG